MLFHMIKIHGVDSIPILLPPLVFFVSIIFNLWHEAACAVCFDPDYVYNAMGADGYYPEKNSGQQAFEGSYQNDFTKIES